MKIAINGMGRIGRAALKVILENPELEIVAVNDIVAIENVAYLLNYDTVYGRYEHKVIISAPTKSIEAPTVVHGVNT